MLLYIFKRLLHLLLTLLGISVIVFFLLHALPGDPVQLLVPPGTPEKEVDAIRTALGLDRPVYVQFLAWLRNLAKGDLGRSVVIATNRPVLPELLPRYLATAQLAFASIVVAVILGISTGIVSAVKRNTLFDAASRLVSLFGVSMPVFWFGLISIILFSVYLGWFPAGGRGELKHLVLPAVTLGVQSSAIISRNTRSAMLEVLGQDYVRTARAKGCLEGRVLFRHALRNALIPVLTVVGLQYGYLLAGAVLTETVFAWPGLGRFLVSAILFRDYPVVQGSILLIAATFAVVNLATDLAFAWLDPRIRYEQT